MGRQRRHSILASAVIPQPPRGASDPIAFTLPWPTGVTANSQWRSGTTRSGTTRVYKTAAAKDWSQTGYVEARLHLREVEPLLAGQIALVLFAHPPDSRRRDPDNLLKLTCDALARGWGIDDSRFRDIRVVMADPVAKADARLEVSVSAFAS